MNIIEMSIEDIIPYENNPRNNEAAICKVADSIQEFGFQQPIVVDKDNVIVAGHTRYEAAKQLNIKVIPVVVAANLTPEQIKAYRLVDNKTAEFSSWDWEKLDAEMKELASVDFDLSSYDLMASSREEDFIEEELGDEEIGEFFEPDNPSSNNGTKKTKTIKCPHCGQDIEL